MPDGFHWRYNAYGGQPIIKQFVMKDTETLTVGDMLNLESGEVDLGVTADTALVGAMASADDPKAERNTSHERTPGKVAGVDSTTVVRAYINPDAVYGCVDANARNAGVTLDLSGATGAQTVGASVNTEFVTVERKLAAADETLVMIIPALHYLTKSQ